MLKADCQRPLWKRLIGGEGGDQWWAVYGDNKFTYIKSTNCVPTRVIPRRWPRLQCSAAPSRSLDVQGHQRARLAGVDPLTIPSPRIQYVGEVGSPVPVMIRRSHPIVIVPVCAGPLEGTNCPSASWHQDRLYDAGRMATAWAFS